MPETGAGHHHVGPCSEGGSLAGTSWRTAGEGVSSSVFYTIGSPGPPESPLQARLTDGSQVFRRALIG
jgi:hypothetical protein